MLPRLFSIGDFSVPAYGILVALGFLMGIWLTVRLARQAGLNQDAVVNLGVYCALGGILGAKVLMIALDPDLRSHPLEIFSLATLQSAGIFYGGFIAALVTAYFVMRHQHLPVLETADVFAPGVALGHGIGRLGCFAAGCCWGRECDLPWAVTFRSPHTTTGVPLNRPLHPTQLYEAAGEWIITLVLLWTLRRKHAPGQIIGLYLALYGLLRFAVEFFRVHDSSNPLGLALSLEQWLALILACAGLCLILRKPRPARVGSTIAV